MAWSGSASPRQSGQAECPEWADLLAIWLFGFHVYMQGSHSQDFTKVEKTSAQEAQKWVPKMEGKIAATECSPTVGLYLTSKNAWSDPLPSLTHRTSSKNMIHPIYSPTVGLVALSCSIASHASCWAIQGIDLCVCFWETFSRLLGRRGLAS